MSDKAMMVIVFRLVQFFCLLLPLISLAQQYNYRHYTTREGLPSMVVYDVMQDKAGYIWLATTEGVARYNGYQFEVFTTEHGLPANEVLGLWEGKSGSIWMLCFRKGVAVFENGKIKPVQFNLPETDLPVKSFLLDTLGNIWLITAKDGIVHYKDSVVNRLDLTDVASKKRYTEPEILADNKGNAWIGGEDSLFLWGKTVQERVPIIVDVELLSSIKPIISSTGVLYAVSSDNVWVYEGGKMIGIAYFNSGLKILRVATGSNGSLLLATSKGAVRFSGTNADNVTQQWYLEGLSVSRVCEDLEGNYWFSTLNDGLYMLSKGSQEIINLNEKDGLFSSLPGSITTYQGKLLVSSNYGDIYALNADNTFEHLKTDRFYGSLGNCQMLPDSSTWCTSMVGLINLEQYPIAQTKKVTYQERVVNIGERYSYGKEIDCINVGAVKSIAQINDSVVMVGSNIGLFEVDLSDNSGPRSSYRCIADRTAAVAYDSIANVVWFATVKGLYYWPMHKPFSMEQDTSLASLKEVPITSLMVLQGVGLLIGTSGNGLYIKTQNGLEQFTRKNGLTSDIINHVLPTRYGILISTSRGLTVLKQDKEQGWLAFPARFNDGLIGEDLRQTLLWQNRLYVLSTKGLSITNPAALQPDSTTPIMHIGKVSIGGRDTTLLAAYTVPFAGNSIRLEYVGLSFKNEGSIIYRYRMEGIDTTWTQTTFTNVQYPSLPPGDYTFYVDSRSPQGPWSNKPATLQITILPPYWQTWWFRTIIGVLLLGIVTGISYSIIRYYRNQSMIAQRMVELEGNALRANMNPHFVFNALNAIHDFIASSDERSAHLYLGKFAQLIRRILDQSRRDFISLEEELDTLKLYLELENMRFEHKFRYEIIVEPGIEPYDIDLPPMLIQPYLENAVRHGLMDLGQPGEVVVGFERVANHLKCTITDNGVGRAKASEVSSHRLKSHRSAGMEITRKRVELLYEATADEQRKEIEIIDLFNENGSPAGTKVIILLPIKEY